MRPPDDAPPPAPAGDPAGAGSSVTAQAARGGAGHPSVHRNIVLALACLAQFMVVLDVSIVNVALPALREDLGFSPTGLQWVVNAYTLTFAGFLLLGGRAGDLYGRRRVFLIGLVLFSVASLACGLAGSTVALVAARAVQGLGAAVLSPTTLTILTTTFTEPRERARALGLWSAALASGGATGALVGGLLTEFLSWRWIFLINLPIGIGALLVTRAILNESRGSAATRSLDAGGALTVTGGLTALVYGVVRTEAVGWTSPQTLVALGVAGTLLATFVVIESRVATAPLVPLGMLRSRVLAGANLAMFFVGASMFAMWYFVSLYLQEVLGHGALRAGLEFLPASIAVIAAAQVSGRLVPRIGPRPLIALAALLSSAGLLWMSRLSADGSYMADVLGPLTLVSIGLGLSFPPGTYAATTGVAGTEAGLASGLVNSTRQIGGAIGLAVLGTVAVDRTAALAGGGGDPGGALTGGFGRALVVAAVVALGSAVAALLLPARGRPAAIGRRPGPAEAPATLRR